MLRWCDALRDRQQRIAAASLAGSPSFAERFIAEHREIAAALQRGDGDAAATLTAAHLRSCARAGAGGAMSLGTAQREDPGAR